MTQSLPQRKLGQHLTVSAIGYGAMGLSEFYGDIDTAKASSMLHEVIDSGVTLIDTADMYGRGANEKLIGSVLKTLPASTRAGLTIASKCGIDRNSTSGYNRNINNHPDYIRKCCDESLARLGIEQIDLYYIHRIDPDAVIEETMQTLADLVKEGKIANVGLCEVSVPVLQRACAVYPVDVVQTEYSLWTREIEDDILPVLKKSNIGLVPYSPLGRGFLTGKIQNKDELSENDFRRTNPRFQDENLEHNKRLLQALEPMTVKYNCTMGQIALAWLLAQWEHIVPIPGTKNPKYLHENNQASLLKLDAADVQTLNDLKNTINIQGERYTPEGMKGIF
ncbi:aldo/keto reductase [Snodgrassella alvi]|uniref:aldo/keto reductase n=1 Tax=Snodgrassella alvi TaxID=1196083 RepID=UPI0034E8BDF6